MNNEDTKYIIKMIENIDDYKNGKLLLFEMHYNLLCLFELIDEINKSSYFVFMFHKYWDCIEEIIAVNKVGEYLETINNKILPDFREWLNDLIKTN